MDCHEGFAKVPSVQIENVLKDHPEAFKDKKLTAKAADALNRMAQDYAGAFMRKPVGHLRNYLDGKWSKLDGKDSADQQEWQDAYWEIANNIWHLREQKAKSADLKQAMAAIRDKYKDVPKSKEGKDAVDAAISMAMNNPRRKRKAGS